MAKNKIAVAALLLIGAALNAQPNSFRIHIAVFAYHTAAEGTYAAVLTRLFGGGFSGGINAGIVKAPASIRPGFSTEGAGQGEPGTCFVCMLHQIVSQ